MSWSPVLRPAAAVLCGGGGASPSPLGGSPTSSFEPRLLPLQSPRADANCRAGRRAVRAGGGAGFSPPTGTLGGRGECAAQGRQRAWTAGPADQSGRRGSSVVTRALPVDSYWITAFQAVMVATLMGGCAVLAGIFINMKIELQALAEYQELEAKGQLPQDISIPEDADFDLNDPLYIFKSKEFPSSSSSRNRPIREELQPEVNLEMEPEMKPELEPELKTAGTKK